mgnify:CR=1 FL=1
MAKYLVIVESPAKVKTVKKYLGANYEVAASMGHVRDLPKSRLGIDVEHDFEPKYITIRGKGELLASLRKKAKKAEIFMAFRLNIGYTDIVLGTRAGFLYDSILIMPSFFCTLLK